MKINYYFQRNVIKLNASLLCLQKFVWKFGLYDDVYIF